jgi:acyl-CoA thioesterase II
MSLEEATQLQGEEGSYSVELSRAWEIWGPNGGYLAALALRAAGMRAEIRQPASFYCHFLRSPDFERVELEVSFLKRGRRSESLAVSMTQRGEPVLHALVRTAADAPGYEHQQPSPPHVPGPHELRAADELRAQAGRKTFPFWENIEQRPIDQSVVSGVQRSEQSAADDARDSERSVANDVRRPPALIREWTRFRPEPCFTDPFVDTARPLILLDTYGWPAAYRRYRDRSMIAPNLDTSVWFHRPPQSSQWLLIDEECTIGHRGLLSASGRVWNLEGQLLASGSAQLCCLPA